MKEITVLGSEYQERIKEWLKFSIDLHPIERISIAKDIFQDLLDEQAQSEKDNG